MNQPQDTPHVSPRRPRETDEGYKRRIIDTVAAAQPQDTGSKGSGSTPEHDHLIAAERERCFCSEPAAQQPAPKTSGANLNKRETSLANALRYTTDQFKQQRAELERVKGQLAARDAFAKRVERQYSSVKQQRDGLLAACNLTMSYLADLSFIDNPKAVPVWDANKAAIASVEKEGK